jgi:hypothetical protein
VTERERDDHRDESGHDDHRGDALAEVSTARSTGTHGRDVGATSEKRYPRSNGDFTVGRDTRQERSRR